MKTSDGFKTPPRVPRAEARATTPLVAPARRALSATPIRSPGGASGLSDDVTVRIGSISFTRPAVSPIASIVNKVGPDGLTPLLRAAKDGNADRVSYLLDNGAHTYTTYTKKRPGYKRNEIEGKTALHFAIDNDNPVVAQELLNWGANPNALLKVIRNEYTAEETPLHCAANKHSIKVLSVLARAPGVNLDALCKVTLNNGNKSELTALYMAVIAGHVDAVVELARAGANLNALSRRTVNPISGKLIVSETPLHVAIDNNHAGIVQALVDAGADLHAVYTVTDKRGNQTRLTPLEKAELSLNKAELSLAKAKSRVDKLEASLDKSRASQVIIILKIALDKETIARTGAPCAGAGRAGGGVGVAAYGDETDFAEATKVAGDSVSRRSWASSVKSSPIGARNATSDITAARRQIGRPIAWETKEDTGPSWARGLLSSPQYREDDTSAPAPGSERSVR